MASADLTMPQTRRPRTRKSLAALPASHDTVTDDKENVTIGHINTHSSDSNIAAGNKRTRSKSMGPGGLDAIKEDGASRRRTVAPNLKSILKPTLPLSPLREIPARKSTSQLQPESPSKTPTKPNVQRQQPENGFGISTPRSPSRIPASPSTTTSPAATQLPKKSADEEARQKQKEEIKRKREERRKSMAGRRVSFAPEATLHTWDMVYDVQEQTSSSESTDSTRRSSGAFSREDIIQEEEDEEQQPRSKRRTSGIPPARSENDVPSSPFSEDSGLVEDGPTDDDSEMDMSNTPTAEDKHLEAMLKEAAHTAGTRGFEYDDNGDVSMELVGDETTAAFKPWVMQSTGLASPHPSKNTTLVQASPTPSARSSNGDMSMDMTSAVGRVLSTQGNPKVVPSRHQSVAKQRRSSGGSSYSDLSMDMTTAVGGIRSRPLKEADESMADENEELSMMEFTNVLGGIKSQNGINTRRQSMARRQSAPIPEDDEDGVDEDSGATMDMTKAVGGIIRSSSTENEGTMDLTDSLGNIQASVDSPTPARAKSARTAAGSPARSVGAKVASPARTSSPATPSKQVTPQAAKATTPGKTPPSKNVAMRNPSPKKLFAAEIRAANSPKPTPKLFQQDSRPHVVLAPGFHGKRRVSGVGADKEGLGSPRLEEMLNRRQSIKDQADVFAPQEVGSRGVRFDDPRSLEQEVAHDYEDEKRRESGQYIVEREADGDTTTNLKDLIHSMSPKKGGRVAGRKSLAVGAARGVLGKRPAELDDSDEDEDNHTARSLRGREASPVKRIRLESHPQPAHISHKPFSNNGRPLFPVDGNARPQTPTITLNVGHAGATTPKSQERFKNTERSGSASKSVRPFGDETAEVQVDQGPDKIALQDFLNLTGIKFMDLTTTKRRPTMAPTAGRGQDDNLVQNPEERFEDSVVAGACTIPMLDMFSHSCRELKKYIAEGRAMVRDFETEVIEENPTLFREYQQATPSERNLMDGQFKSVKTHARLSSKGMWYEWRMKLLDGIKEELRNTAAAMKNDESYLVERLAKLESSLPMMDEERSTLQQEVDRLQSVAKEMDASDPAELQAAREQLQEHEQEILRKKDILGKLEVRAAEADSKLNNARAIKADCEASILEAQRLREECRDWSISEVNTLKAEVEQLEAKTGWKIHSASSNMLEMSYRNQLQLYFDVTAFMPAAASPSVKPNFGNSVLSLSYIGDDDSDVHRKPEPLTTEKRFFLQIIRAHLHCLPKAQTHVRELLKFVASSWTTALAASDEIRRLDMLGATRVDIASDERLEVRSSILLPNVQTKLLVGFELAAAPAADNQGLRIRTGADAKVAYGERYREDKMREFLISRGAADGVLRSGAWAAAVTELRKKLIAQGRKRGD